jgi:hypothetical protein
MYRIVLMYESLGKIENKIVIILYLYYNKLTIINHLPIHRKSQPFGLIIYQDNG